jgi:thiol-disulfide isomerase/thioredoxin
MSTGRTLMFASLLALSGLLLSVAQIRADEKKKEGKKSPTILNKTDELKDTDEKDTNQFTKESPRKVYKVKLIEGKTYQLDLKSTDFDAVLRIENAEGKEVAFNDDAPGEKTLDSRIIYKAPKTEEYKIIATCLDTKPGNFTLTIVEKGEGKAVGGGASQFKGDGTELAMKDGKATFKGELTAKDSAVGAIKGLRLPPGDRYYKVFTVKLESGKTYRIDMKETGGDKDFDALLFLEDANGKILAINDDAEPGKTLDSRIVHKAAADGTYRIICTTLVADQTGKFSLEVTPPTAAEQKEIKLIEDVGKIDKASAAEKKTLLQDVTKLLESKAGKLSQMDFQLASAVTGPVEGTAEAVGVCKTFAKIFADADTPQVAVYAKIFSVVGKEFPITGKTLAGKDFDIKNMKGKFVLVDFWGTWCPPCVAEIPNIIKAHEKFHGKGFDVIGVTQPAQNQDDDGVSSYLEKRKMPWTCINIEDSAKLIKMHGVPFFPYPILVGPDGRVISAQARGPQLERLLERLVTEKK